MREYNSTACLASTANPSPDTWILYGGFILLLYGVVGMFWGMAYVCEEYSVPAITVFCKRCKISDDVAGAIFIGAGLSLPVAFVSFVGLFAFQSAIGVGTVFGGTIFNQTVNLIVSIIVAPNRKLTLDKITLTREVVLLIVSCILVIWTAEQNIITGIQQSLQIADYSVCLSISPSASLTLSAYYALYCLIEIYFPVFEKFVKSTCLHIIPFHESNNSELVNHDAEQERQTNTIKNPQNPDEAMDSFQEESPLDDLQLQHFRNQLTTSSAPKNNNDTKIQSSSHSTTLTKLNIPYLNFSNLFSETNKSSTNSNALYGDNGETKRSSPPATIRHRKSLNTPHPDTNLIQNNPEFFPNHPSRVLLNNTHRSSKSIAGKHFHSNDLEDQDLFPAPRIRNNSIIKSSEEKQETLPYHSSEAPYIREELYLTKESDIEFFNIYPTPTAAIASAFHVPSAAVVLNDFRLYKKSRFYADHEFGCYPSSRKWQLRYFTFNEQGLYYRLEYDLPRTGPHVRFIDIFDLESIIEDDPLLLEFSIQLRTNRRRYTFRAFNKVTYDAVMEQLHSFILECKKRNESERLAMSLQAINKIGEGVEVLPNPDSESIEDSNFIAPISLHRKLFYYAMLPQKVMIYLTVPDVKKESRQNAVVLSMLLGFMWLAIQSYVLVICLSKFGDLFNLNSALLGLTIGAWASNYPALWSSLVVARDGFGDIAICNAFGSNVFSFNIGLGLPWLCYSVIYGGMPYANLQDAGVTLCTLLLIFQLITVYVGVIISDWQLTNRFIPVLATSYIMYISFVCYINATL